MVKYVRPNGGDVEFGAHAREVLMQMRQLDDDAPESGGVLLGRLVVSTEDVVVDEVTTPGPYDKGSRYLFRRSRRSAQPRVTAAWSCALGFSWTLDCERVLAGGVSR